MKPSDNDARRKEKVCSVYCIFDFSQRWLLIWNLAIKRVLESPAYALNVSVLNCLNRQGYLVPKPTRNIVEDMEETPVTYKTVDFAPTEKTQRIGFL
jgi:hypothetical protein